MAQQASQTKNGKGCHVSPVNLTVAFLSFYG